MTEVAFSFAYYFFMYIFERKKSSQRFSLFVSNLWLFFTIVSLIILLTDWSLTILSHLKWVKNPWKRSMQVKIIVYFKIMNAFTFRFTVHQTVNRHFIRTFCVVFIDFRPLQIKKKTKQFQGCKCICVFVKKKQMEHTLRFDSESKYLFSHWNDENNVNIVTHKIVNSFNELLWILSLCLFRLFPIEVLFFIHSDIRNR